MQIPLMLEPCETVAYVISTTTTAQYGSSVSAKFHNSAGAELFSDAWFMNPNAIATLPRSAPYIRPYRSTRTSAGRPVVLVLKSLNNPLSYSVTATRNPRPGVNLGGTGMADAPLIAPFETQYGTIHHFEGRKSDLNGQWYEVSLNPGQAIYLTGTALGSSSYGGSLAIELRDETGAYILDLVNVAAYGALTFPASGQERVHVHGGTQPATYFLRIYAPVWVCHEFSFTVKTPRLTANPAAPVRGATASLMVQDAPGATATAWRLVTPVGTATRQSTGSLSWGGTIAMGGQASVTVAWRGKTFTLQHDLPVLPRTDFVSPPVAAEDSNRQPPSPPVWTVACGSETGEFLDPPAAMTRLGMMCINTNVTFQTSARIADSGPNHGFFYVTAYQDTTRFRWWLHPHLNDTASEFYQAQYGTYNGTTGYIAKEQLVSNAREHESGTIRGHYQQYVASVADHTLNAGRQVEQQVGGPAVPSVEAFVAQVSDAMTAINTAIMANTTQEHYPCNSFVEWSPQCVYAGPINYPPYQPQ